MDNDLPSRGNGWQEKKENILWRLQECEREIEDLKKIRDQVIEARGGVRMWLLILTLIGAPVLSAGTTWALRSYEDKRVNTLMVELIERLDRQNRAERGDR